jgi:beta-mannanase
MNGTWFPWSGCFYGAGAIVPGTGPPGKLPVQYLGPETFKKAYRHVVDRVRARSATNVLWVFHAINYPNIQDSWNMLGQYYPGSDYVDWFGFSVYGEQFAEEPWSPFTPLLDWPYDELCALDPNKPVIVAEWGIGEFPKKGSKAAFIAEAFESMRKNFPRLKAAVFWDERWQNAELDYSNLRVNSSPESLAAYRHGVADPFWLGSPLLIPETPAHSSQSGGK